MLLVGFANDRSKQISPSLAPVAMPELHLRLMTDADIAMADALRQAVGWNQLPRDWERLLAHDPDGCFVAEWNGTAVGTATTTCYGTELAWIGMVLVHPDHRRHGIGKALLLHCLEHLDRKQIACIKLDATPLGKTLYDQLGFVEEWTLARWETATPAESPAPAPRGDLRTWSDTDESWISSLDASAFGVPRMRMVHLLAKQSRVALVHPSPEGHGYGLLREGARAAYVGPIIADAPAVGLKLANALIDRAPAGPLFWDIPDHNQAAVALAVRRGFRQQRPLIRMFRGTNSFPGRPELCFALADPSIG